VTELALTENVWVRVKKTLAGAEATFGGGYTEHTPTGWAFVVGDRFTRHGLEPRVEGWNDGSRLTLKSRALDARDRVHSRNCVPRSLTRCRLRALERHDLRRTPGPLVCRPRIRMRGERALRRLPRREAVDS
jgi:hypothetical protein